MKNNNFRRKLLIKGIPHIRGSGSGDQIIEVYVEIPTALNKRQEEFLTEFEKLFQKAN